MKTITWPTFIQGMTQFEYYIVSSKQYEILTDISEYDILSAKDWCKLWHALAQIIRQKRNRVGHKTKHEYRFFFAALRGCTDYSVILIVVYNKYNSSVSPIMFMLFSPTNKVCFILYRSFTLNSLVFSLCALLTVEATPCQNNFFFLE